MGVTQARSLSSKDRIPSVGMEPEFGDRPAESATLGMAVDSAILRAAGEMVILNIYAGSDHSNQPSLINLGGCLSDSSRQQS